MAGGSFLSFSLGPLAALDHGKGGSSGEEENLLWASVAVFGIEKQFGAREEGDSLSLWGFWVFRYPGGRKRKRKEGGAVKKEKRHHRWWVPLPHHSSRRHLTGAKKLGQNLPFLFPKALFCTRKGRWDMQKAKREGGQMKIYWRKWTGGERGKGIEEEAKNIGRDADFAPFYDILLQAVVEGKMQRPKKVPSGKSVEKGPSLQFAIKLPSALSRGEGTSPSFQMRRNEEGWEWERHLSGRRGWGGGGEMSGGRLRPLSRYLASSQVERGTESGSGEKRENGEMWLSPPPSLSEIVASNFRAGVKGKTKEEGGRERGGIK